MAEHNEFGKEAEKYAESYLKEKGYGIVAKNWFFNKAEIDIIAKFQNQIIIVEVKALHSDGLTNPEDAVNSKKRKLLIMAADEYIQQNNIVLEARFDIISMVKTGTKWKISHLEDAYNSVN